MGSRLSNLSVRPGQKNPIDSNTIRSSSLRDYTPRTHRDRLAPEEQVPRGLPAVGACRVAGRQYQRMKESAQVRYSGATISTMRPASSRPNKPNRHSTNGVGSGSEWLEAGGNVTHRCLLAHADAYSACPGDAV